MSEAMDNANLLPCPFCGGPATEIVGLVGCEPCAIGRRDAASWNRRSALASANEMNERLREALIYLVNAHEFVEKRRGVLPEVPKALAQARTLLQSIDNKGDGSNE